MDHPFDFLRDKADEFCSLGDAYAYARFTTVFSSPDESVLSKKADGFVIIIVKEGTVEIEINMERHRVERDSIIVSHVTSSISSFSILSKKIDLYCICFSPAFLHTVNINYAAISIQSFVEKHSPVQTLTSEECSLMINYFGLLRSNARSCVSPQIEAHIAASLTAAMIYQMVLINYRRIGHDKISGNRGGSRTTIVRDFIKLVHVHYTTERSVGFYAGRLCISPKYLSLLVKEATGKSAARWIDEFVLMEAKNLLRYSGKNVQQVAYALNFPNQSSFGKFFKHLTGQSPTAYQKS